MVWSLSQIHWAAESTGDGSNDSQLWGESTGGSALDKSLVCLVSLIPSLFIWSWPFFYTILDPRLNTTDYFWSQVFQVNIISSLEYKTNILISALDLNHISSWFLSLPHSASLRDFYPLLHLTPTLLINIFDVNARCSNTQSGECLRCN